MQMEKPPRSGLFKFYLPLRKDAGQGYSEDFSCGCHLLFLSKFGEQEKPDACAK
jgi:hypothetical protein